MNPWDFCDGTPADYVLLNSILQTQSFKHSRMSKMEIKITFR